MKLEPLNIHDHTILNVVVEGDVDHIQLAYEQAILKAEKVHKNDPSGRRRDKDEIVSQNFLGTLADLSCAKIMQRYFKKHQKLISVIRYDDVRTDNFQEHDQYDIMLVAQEQQYLVEVRSSVCVMLPLEDMIRRWQVLGAYVSEAKGVTETCKPYYLRPLYHLTTYETNKRKKRYQKRNSFNLISTGELQLYFVGGATGELLESKGRNEEGYELKQGKSKFRVIDILDGLDAKEILEEISMRHHFVSDGF